MEFQAEIIRAIQSVASPALDAVFQIITVIGEELFLLPVAALLFWCVNKELGYWICWCAAQGNLLVNTVKGIFKVERPIGYEGIRTLRAQTATGYSFPSGHTQSCANLFTALARAVNRKRFWILAFVLPLLVGISRLYLGCHWPMDVAASYAIGICLPPSSRLPRTHILPCSWIPLPLLLWLLYRKFANHKALLFLISTLIFAPFCLMRGNIADFWKSFGFAVGLSAATYIETKFIKFSVEGTLKQRALRFAIGLVLIVLAYLPPKLLLPANNLTAFCRYLIIPIVAIAVWPAIFKKLKL